MWLTVTFNPMADMLKVTAQWTGFLGAPGYSNFFFMESDPTASTDGGSFASADAVQNFFNAIKSYLPNQAQVKVMTDVPVINPATGEMTDIRSAGTRTAIQGTGGSASYSAASGVVITWRTPGVKNGRRVRGRTFIVPTTTAAYDIDGSLHATGIGVFQTAAAGLIGAGTTQDFGVWSRPTAPGASDGAWFTATSGTVPDKVAILKSRRD